ncbi:protein kinase [Novymonas esmeraldas]|uniref:non-specific serine/threonine protein kinase n=1 Tax=Novymonas esmeraldas TaxID=1808958 RepID=A0AAW0EQU6_9TRYP
MMNFLGGPLGGGGGGHRKDKGFSSKNKVQQYHGDGTESIIVMGRPFRVLQKISDVPPPYIVGRQRSLKYGEGGSSYVYLVENSSLLPEFPRHLALKRSFFGVDQVAEAHKEVDIVSRVKDKNIVRVYHSEISRNEGRLGVSIAMEYCSNNLYRRIRSSAGSGAGTRLTEGEICHVMLAVTSAVGYLHTQQPPITHRDIRPENILLNNKLTGPAAYKLTNFGNAATEAYHCETREEANMAIADIQMHTNPAFRAPEMADPWSKKRICEKTDMWAIGVLLYYMMYLRLPFDPSTAIGQENWVVRFPPQTMGSYTGSLRVMVEHLLDPNPESRWDVFALTNFMRFDEDCSRHLGTFCFTKTEWPEGWEEQEVKVLGRTAPAKAPPLAYGEPGHEQLDHRSRSATSPTPSHRDVAAPSATRAHGGSTSGGGGSGGGVDAVQDAMMVLGGDPADDDPEMAEYRRQIIKEQEEAWERAKAASGRQSAPPPAPVRETPQEAKKDVFDDLFAGPSPAASPASPVSAPSNAGSPVAAAMAPPQPKKDIFSTDDLFGSTAPPPQPQPTMMATYGQAPQQQQQQQQPAMAGWGSGAPTMMGGGGYPVAQQQQWQYGGGSANAYNTPAPLPPQQQQQQQQHLGGYQGGGGYPMQQPQQQQSYQTNAPPQQSMNFMTPAPGQQATYRAPEPETRPATNTTATTTTSKKDPFADLFN